MPGRNKVPCHCERHNGEYVHYSTRLRCQQREERASKLAFLDMNMDDSESSSEDDESKQPEGSVEDDVEGHSEIDVLCLRLYADFITHNGTQDGVTANLRSWLESVGKYLPDELRESMPTTCKQLIAHFQTKMISLIRLPVCPGGCSILDDVTPSLRFSCWCNGSQNVPWRETKSGALVAQVEYVTIALSEVIQSW